MNYYFLRNSRNKGQALILVYMVIAVFIIICVGLLSKAINEKNLSLRNKLTNEAFYLAEGATESAISAFISAIANYQISPAIDTYNFNTVFTAFGGATVNSTINRLEDVDRIIMEGQTNILVRNYEVISTAVHPLNNSISVTLHQIIGRRLIPTFQHAVFYNDDLEVLPGANMTLSGRIHTNKDIYLDAELGRTLTIDSTSLHSAGNVYNQRKDSGAELAGEVSIRVNKPGSPKYENMANLDSDDSNWTTESTDRWKGTVQNAVHGVTQLAVPSVGSIQPDGYYHSRANIVIVNNTITRNGVTLVEGTDYPAGTIATTETLYNNREGQYIRTTNIDLKKLAGATGGYPGFPNNLPSNGLLYATRDDSANPGIRLTNASEIYRTGGLTLVSNDPVYVQGNYNNTNEKPASVICDSLNLLSNNWSDAKSTQGVNNRVANTTTVNCAFVAGVDTTSSGNYNGGLENYPRLHEKWTGIQLNIKGSFVALWNSSVADGAWRYGDPQYTAPTRNWSYNTNFNNTANLPPFTPWAVEARRIAWWKD